jgi:hypothetical protein
MSPAEQFAEAGSSLYAIEMARRLMEAERDFWIAKIAEMDRRKAEREAGLLAAALPAGMAREVRHGN